MSDIGLGTRIGDYRVVALIGQGGMGTVYRAQHVGTGATVALKVLSDSLAASEPFRRRFVREARYARELDHPNVIRVDEVGDDAGCMYMVMPEVRGADLKMLLTLDGPLESARAIAILTPIADALDALHARGILHRDIKPGNVIVASGEGPERAGTAYLTDFGLGKDPSRDSGPLTAVGEFVGTFHYAAPEQVLGHELDHRVDVYAFGCLLYECLTGQPPFARERAVDVLDAHLEDPPPKVTAMRPDLPPEIDDVVARAMAKDRDDRFATGAETVEAARTAMGVAEQLVEERPETGAPSAASLDRGARAPGHERRAAGSTPGALRLRAVSGKAAGSDILVTDELVIGRACAGDGRLAGDPQISRRHARIWRSDVGFMVVDLGSTNGTLVGGRAITEPRLLVAGDTLDVGETKLVVEAALSAATAAPSSTTAAPASQDRAPAPAVSLRLEIDFSGGRALVALDGGEAPLGISVRSGRWSLEPPDG